MFTATQRSPTVGTNLNQTLAHEVRLNRLHRLFKSQIHVTEPSLILEPYLFLGNCISAQDINRLSKLGIRYVLNVAIRDVETCPYYSNDMRILTIDLRDDHRENIARAFDQAFSFIDDAKREKSRVLVHCSHGQSRSPAIVIGYLMRTYNVSLEQCLIHVIKARPCIIPNDGFLKQLILFDCFLVERRRRQQEAKLTEHINKAPAIEISIQRHPVVPLQPVQPSAPVVLATGVPLQPAQPSAPVVPIQLVRPSRPTVLVPSVPHQPVRLSHPSVLAPPAPRQPVQPSPPAVLAPAVPFQTVRLSHPTVLVPSAPLQPKQPSPPAGLVPSVPLQPVRPSHLTVLVPSAPFQPKQQSPPAVLAPVVSLQSVRPSRPAVLVPTAPDQPVRPSPPAHSVRPSPPAQSVRPSHPAVSVQSFVLQPVRPSPPAQSVRPSHPAVLVPTAPDQPVRPSAPAQSVRPSPPAHSVRPSPPAQSVQPSHPAVSVQSFVLQPVRPSPPAQSVRPSHPAVSVQSFVLQPVRPSPSAVLVRPQHPAISTSNMTTIQSVDSSSMGLSPTLSNQSSTSNKSIRIIPFRVPREIPISDKIDPVPVEKVSSEDATVIADANKNVNQLQEKLATTNQFKLSDKTKLIGSLSQYALPSKKLSDEEKTKAFDQHPPRLPRSSTADLGHSHANQYNRPSFTPSIQQWNIDNKYPINYHVSDKHVQKECIYEIYDKATNRFIPPTCF